MAKRKKTPKRCDISGCVQPNAGWIIEGRLNDEKVRLVICDHHHRMMESPMVHYSVTTNGTMIDHRTLMTQPPKRATERWW